MIRALALLLVAGCTAALDPCAELPTCDASAAEAYGTPCAIGFVDGWRGRPVCCSAGVVAASCIPRAVAGGACDSAAPASCSYPLTCGADERCAPPKGSP